MTRTGEEQQQPETRPCLGSPPLHLTPNQHVVGVWKYLLYARKHIGLSAHSKFQQGLHCRLCVPCLPWPHLPQEMLLEGLAPSLTPTPQLPRPGRPSISFAVAMDFLGLAFRGTGATSCCLAVSLGFSALCNPMAGARATRRGCTARRRWVFTETEIEMASLDSPGKLGSPGCYCCF